MFPDAGGRARHAVRQLQIPFVPAVSPPRSAPASAGRARGKNRLPASGYLGPTIERRQRHGVIVEYPRVCNRVPLELAWDYPEQFYWLYCWSVQDREGCWQSRSCRVPRDRLWTVRAAIGRKQGVAAILDLIRGRRPPD